jgi:hypothetical protein
MLANVDVLRGRNCREKQAGWVAPELDDGLAGV